MAKKANISKQKASERAKKGWITRHRKGLGIGGTTAYLSKRRTINAYNNTKYQHTWTRPTGQKIKLKGFKPKYLKHAQAGLTAIDRNLHPVNIDVGEIRAERVVKPLRTKLGGVYVPGRDGGVDRLWEGTRHSMPNEVPGNAMRRLQTAAGRTVGMAPEKHGHITINSHMLTDKYQKPGLGEKAITKVLHKLDPTSTEEFSTGRFNPAGTIVHEVGHAVDAGSGRLGVHRNNDLKTFDYLSKPKEFGEAFKWGVNKEKTDFEHKSGYKGRGYQASLPVEEFAETFRARIGTPIASKPATAGADRFNPILTRSKVRYMERHYIKPKPSGVTAMIDPSKHMGRHIDKMLIGGAVVGAAGGGYYAYHKYHTDKKFKKSVDRHVLNTKKRLRVRH